MSYDKTSFLFSTCSHKYFSNLIVAFKLSSKYFTSVDCGESVYVTIKLTTSRWDFILMS